METKPVRPPAPPERLRPWKTPKLHTHAVEQTLSGFLPLNIEDHYEFSNDDDYKGGGTS